MNKSLSLFVLIYLLAASPSQAVFERGGNLGDGARAIGLGGAWVGVAEDLSTLYWNPAGLIRTQSGTLATEGATLQGERDLLYGIRAATHTSLGVRLGGSFEWARRSAVNTISEGRAALGAAFPLSKPGWGWGLSFKPLVVRGPTEALSGKGFGIDVGFTGEFALPYKKQVRWGVALYDIVHSFRWDNGVKETLPAWFSLGASGSPIRDVMVATAIDLPDNRRRSIVPGRSMIFRLGAEAWRFKRTLGGRFGMTTLRSGQLQWSLGFTYRAKAWEIHYAFLTHQDLRASHRVTVVAKPCNCPKPEIIRVEPKPRRPKPRYSLAATVYFDNDKSDLLPKVMAVLDDILDESQKLGSYSIFVYGHTSSPGHDRYNEFLSEERAQAVWDILSKYLEPGTPAGIKGLGESHLIYDEKTGLEDQPLSRRVEIYVVPREKPNESF